MSLQPHRVSFSTPTFRRDSSTTELSDIGSEVNSLTTTSSLSDDECTASARAPGSVGIIGMACRLPGARNPSQLWENIVQKKDLQKKMPADRFNIDAFYHPEGSNKGTVSATQFTQILTDTFRLTQLWVTG